MSHEVGKDVDTRPVSKNAEGRREKETSTLHKTFKFPFSLSSKFRDKEKKEAQVKTTVMEPSPQPPKEIPNTCPPSKYGTSETGEVLTSRDTAYLLPQDKGEEADNTSTEREGVLEAGEEQGANGMEEEVVRKTIEYSFVGGMDKAEKSESEKSQDTDLNSASHSHVMATEEEEDKCGDAVIHTLTIPLIRPQAEELTVQAVIKEGTESPLQDSHTEQIPLTTSEDLPSKDLQDPQLQDDVHIKQDNHIPAKDAQLQASTSTKASKAKKKKQKAAKSAGDSRDSDSSVASTKKKEKSKKPQVKSKFAPGSLEYIEDLLRGRIFSGWVEERRWVEGMGGYRDIVEVDEWEGEMNQVLRAIVKSIPGVQEGTKWINITAPRESPCYRLWVLLPVPPIPGHHWYAITAVHLQPQFGLRLSLKQIRAINPHDLESESERKKRHQRLAGGLGSEAESLVEQLHTWTEQVQQMNPAALWSAITSTITISNIKETVRFLVVLVMTLVIGLVTVVKESHHIGLRFIREAGIFFHHATPFLQTLIGFVEKLVGGMYLLIAMVYRDIRRPSMPRPGPPPGPPPRSLMQGPGMGPPLTPAGAPAIKYVSPQQWVYRNQNNDSPGS